MYCKKCGGYSHGRRYCLKCSYEFTQKPEKIEKPKQTEPDPAPIDAPIPLPLTGCEEDVRITVFDLFRIRAIKHQMISAMQELSFLQLYITPEMHSVILMDRKIKEKEAKIKELDNLIAAKTAIVEALKSQSADLDAEIAQKKRVLSTKE